MAGASIPTAKVEKKLQTKTVIISAILLIFMIMAFAFACYNLIYAIGNVTGRASHILYFLGFIIGMILIYMYVSISFTTVFSTLLAQDRKNLILKRWENGFLPNDQSCKIPFIKEFKPAKTEISKVPIQEITSIIIGTGTFIKRHANVTQIDDEFKTLESASVTGKRLMRRIDILYLETAQDECIAMSIENYDSKAVTKIIQGVMRINPTINIYIGSRR